MISGRRRRSWRRRWRSGVRKTESVVVRRRRRRKEAKNKNCFPIAEFLNASSPCAKRERG